MRKYITILLSVFYLVGCTTTSSIMASWVGKSADSLTASWGAPSSTIARGDGGTTYTYTTFGSNQYGLHQCRQSFVVDQGGTIISWAHSGCRRFVFK